MVSTAYSRTLFTRSARRGVQMAMRDPQRGSIIATFSGALLLLQLLFLAFVSVQAVEDLTSSRADLHVTVLRSASDQAVQDLFSALHELPSVARVTYTTREQAYEDEKKKNPDLVSFLDQFHLENPFPDTFVVTLQNFNDFDPFLRFLEQDRFRKVVDPSFFTEASAQEQTIQEFLQLTSALQILSVLFFAATTAILLSVLVSVIAARATMRAKDVVTEHLLGAKQGTTFLPFILEESFLLLVAWAVSVLVFALVLVVLPFVIPALQEGGSLMNFSAQTWVLLVWAFPVCLLLEIIALPLLAYVGVRRGSLSVLSKRSSRR